MELNAPTCKFCKSNNTRFVIGHNGEIRIRCSDCMRLYDINTPDSEPELSPEPGQKTVTAAPHEERSTMDHEYNIGYVSADTPNDIVHVVYTPGVKIETKDVQEATEEVSCEYYLPCGLCKLTKETCTFIK